MKKIILLILLGLFLASPVKAATVHFFYGETCPHCHKAEVFLEGLEEKYPDLEIRSYEVFGDRKNADLFLKLLEDCGEEKKLRVPAIFIGNEVVIGFLEGTSESIIEKKIENCLEKNCSGLAQKTESCPTEGQIISLPFIGQTNLSKFSLPVLTVIIGGIDGFNPCAMWVLVFLLALLINIKSRKKMWLIGGAFILASGVIYYLLLAAWLNVFLAISYVSLIRMVIGILAVIFGVLQLKKFTTMKPGVCTVSTSKIEEKFKHQAEKVVATPVLLASIFGVVLLAIGVNLIEFFCSAGLPAIYTQTLSLSHLNPLSYYLYLLLYTFIFMLDDLIVFVVAVITLDKLGYTDKYSKWSTLIGGIIILLLGIALILKPELLIFG